MRCGHAPGSVDAAPELGLLAAAAGGGGGYRDDEGGVIPEFAHLDVQDRARGCPAAAAPERADRVVADEDARRIAAQGFGSRREQPVERLEVVGHERALVVPEGVEDLG